MSNKPKVYVAAVGMITPVGANAEMTAAAVKAGVSGFSDSQFYNKNFKPMRMALVPEDALPPLNEKLDHAPGLTSRQRRMLRLATPALNEVMKVIPLVEPPPLFLALPESLPDCPSIIAHDFIDKLQIQSDIKLDGRNSRLFSTGRAGGLQAIDLVFKYFESTGKDVALVGGVDTYLDLRLLGILDSQDRILAENIMDGFVPGEAAGFLMLVSERVVNKLPTKPLAILYQPGLAQEPGHRYSKEPYRGDGLAEAFRLALEQSNGDKINSVYSSMNGENFWAKEFGVATMRNKSGFIDHYEVIHPADSFADVGAAFASVLIGVTTLCSKQLSTNSIVTCSSDTYIRASVCLFS